MYYQKSCTTIQASQLFLKYKIIPVIKLPDYTARVVLTNETFLKIHALFEHWVIYKKEHREPTNETPTEIY